MHAVVVRNVLAEDLAQVRFVERHQVVRALTSNAADDAFGEGVLQREARSVSRERADESQQVQGEVHPERSRAALGGASSVRGIESNTRV